MTIFLFAQPPMASRHRVVTRKQQRGVSLLEVMISILIMGIGLLGIAAMQATALRNGQSSFERAQTVIQSYAILDVMRANKSGATAGYYDTGGLRCVSPAVDADKPAGYQSAQAEVAQWLYALKNAVGRTDDQTTCASIACAGNTFDGTTCTVTIRWDDSRGSSASGQPAEGSEGSAAREAVTVSAL